jgi:chaperonin GroES
MPAPKPKQQSRFNPRPGNVLVQVEKAADTTASGLFIPESGRERPSEGIIVAIHADDPDFATNDHIVFGKWNGTWLKVDEIDYLLLETKYIQGWRR